MVFSSPDYPVFLIAVFLLYALARWGGGRLAWARLAVMVLLGDVVFMLVARDPDALWDPIGGPLIRIAVAAPDWPAVLVARWAIGGAVLVCALVLGRRGGDWIESERGQAAIARGLVLGVLAIGATVAIAWSGDALDQVTRAIAGFGHLAVLGALGVGLGATQAFAHRALGRVVILFVASSLFYHAWAATTPGPYRYLLALLLGTIALDYYLALWIERSERPAWRTALVVASLCSNLGILAFFKYADFLVHDVARIDAPYLHLILPAGISFHTFQSLSYTIDVYRRQLRATRSVIQFASFVLFFPQLVAGPIVRAQDLLPQLDDLPALDRSRAAAGLFRIAVGLAKKIGLADRLGFVLVDRVFDAPGRFSALEVVAAVYGYALQIYLDFSAYSDIAIGSAQVLGFTLPENFSTPYRAANLQEFWRRWHMSLSSWLRDYLYVALGGNRGAAWRTYANLILTMVLGGLWHGPSWVFAAWGALHGAGLAVTRYFQRSAWHSPGAVRRRFAACAAIAVAGLSIAGVAIPRIAPEQPGTWPQLAVAWLAVVPLWAVLTAWLSRDPPAPIASPGPAGVSGAAAGAGPSAAWHRRALPALLRLAMCGAGLGSLAALAWLPSATWIPLAGATWALGIAADALEIGAARLRSRLSIDARRAIAAVLVFHYVCFAWVFFRASSFDRALAVFRQIATLETDRANLVPIVALVLFAGLAGQLFADGSFRWLRERFVALPAWAQGAALAGATLILRELGHTAIVPFIYFQF
jgi:D-alanyl-lipoteichoic acid acyltransferase DltB (MBOAT superfamily)